VFILPRLRQKYSLCSLSGYRVEDDVMSSRLVVLSAYFRVLSVHITPPSAKYSLCSLPKYRVEDDVMSSKLVMLSSYFRVLSVHITSPSAKIFPLFAAQISGGGCCNEFEVGSVECVFPSIECSHYLAFGKNIPFVRCPNNSALNWSGRCGRWCFAEGDTRDNNSAMPYPDFFAYFGASVLSMQIHCGCTMHPSLTSNVQYEIRTLP
jgi:hypothetical protein